MAFFRNATAQDGLQPGRALDLDSLGMKNQPTTESGATRKFLTLRGRHLLLFDAAATALSFIGALALRFDAPSTAFDAHFAAFAWVIWPLIVVRIAAFLWLRLYQRAWRYASVDELVAVVAAVLGSSVIAYALVFAAVWAVPGRDQLGFPRSVVVIDTFLIIALTGAWRFGLRIVGAGRAGASDGKRALVVGGGNAASRVIRELRENRELGLYPIGILADELPRGQRVLGLVVFGPLVDLAGVVRAERVDVVLLALPEASGSMLRKLVKDAEALGVRCLTVPSVAEVVAGRVRMNAIREVELEDLLRRAPARIDLEFVSTSFNGRRVLITGAGGSIGGELARQILRFSPRQLVILGRGENSVFETLQSLPPGAVSEVVPIILDIRDRDRVDALVRDLQPDVVFHAAAHKHVTFMEQFPEEAVQTNVLGTSYLLSSCARYRVGTFVLISTDKAVNPTSVMGATKRVAELLVQSVALQTGAKYVSVRFGNVLSSRGSVVPVFRRQLEAGGPLTVTHPDVTRYFMTIPEAIQLVLQAAVLAQAGDTFILDMGEPIKIADLARELARLHGLEVGKDIEIEFIGLRPGEKMTEELLLPFESAESTKHPAIARVRLVTGRQPDVWQHLSVLPELISRQARPEIVSWLQRAVREYEPAATESSEQPRARAEQ
jgi:FlaA1/EpsC-like NDP-sugar epimerase